MVLFLVLFSMFLEELVDKRNIRLKSEVVLGDVATFGDRARSNFGALTNKTSLFKWTFLLSTIIPKTYWKETKKELYFIDISASITCGLRLYHTSICNTRQEPRGLVGRSVISDPAVPGSNFTTVSSLFLCHYFSSKWGKRKISKSFACSAMASAHACKWSL